MFTSVSAIIHLRGMFLSSHLLWEYWIELFALGIPFIRFTFQTRIRCRGVWGFLNGCPFDVWRHGLKTCLRYAMNVCVCVFVCMCVSVYCIAVLFIYMLHLYSGQQISSSVFSRKYPIAATRGCIIFYACHCPQLRPTRLFGWLVFCWNKEWNLIFI